MLQIRHGDLLAAVTENGVIAHGCNAVGVMEAGFAAKARKLYPKVYEDYIARYSEFDLRLGEVILTELPDNLVIASCITQYAYGKSAKYIDERAIIRSLESVAATSESRGLPLHFPLIGGGYGGGQFNTLVSAFKHALRDRRGTLWLL